MTILYKAPYARLSPIVPTAVTLEDDFWAPRHKLNRHATLPAQYARIVETGRLANFYRAAGKTGGPFQGYMYNDSDVYKWLEGAAWALAFEPGGELADMVNTVISAIEAAQDVDGYIDTYFTFERVAQRWTNLADLHELYCLGHLIQAATAHARATGSDQLLNVARRGADNAFRIFGPGARPGVPGHPEVELALVDLFRLTGDERYFVLAQSFVDNRGRGLIGGRDYHQDHIPYRQMPRLVGHAVRALYLSSAATDIYQHTGEAELRQAIDRLWQVFATSQVYVSGGVGSRHDWEAFGEPYELPNSRAYTESCAAIASMMWNQRLLNLDGDPRYADLMEWTLYNAVLPGLALDGESYFYINPLASVGEERRQTWFPCACCPPNLARLVASLPGYLYSLSDDGIWVNLYAQSRARLSLGGGEVELQQKTDYPWDGEIEVEIAGVNGLPDGEEFSLQLRVPGWATGGSSAVLLAEGGEQRLDAKPGSYLHIRRAWKAGDRVKLSLPVPVRYLESHPYVMENTARVAVARGPILYCLEAVDNPGVDLRIASMNMKSTPSVNFRSDLLGGANILQLQAKLIQLEPGWQGKLYRDPGEIRQGTPEAGILTFIPYYAWANRAPGAMQVWVRKE